VSKSSRNTGKSPQDLTRRLKAAKSRIGRAARRAGVSVDEYEQRRAIGEKYCWDCRRWLLEASFGMDASRGDGFATRCRDCGNRAARERYRGRRAKTEGS